MVKVTAKKIIKRLEERRGWAGKRLFWGYRSIPKKALFLNFILQRVLRINSETPWSVNFTSVVKVPEKIKAGRNSARSFALSIGCYIQGGNGIEIGDDTIWGPGVKIISADHGLEGDRTWKKEDPVKIGRNCWIGANAVILPGVFLGDNVVVGAGAIVTKSFEEGNCVIAGNPARIIKRLSSEGKGFDK